MVLDQQEKLTRDLLPFLRVHEDGTVERLYSPQLVPPAIDTKTGVRSKDIIISPNVSARIYLPSYQTNHNRPILVYFHGGGFCIESAFSTLGHQFSNTISSQANALVVSVEYRLAPEHPLPAAYDDSWTALQWVASHSTKDHNQAKVENYEPWLTQHGDFDHLYIGGSSSGANISHHMALRAGLERLQGGVKIHGMFLSHPYFLGSEPVGSEPDLATRESTMYYYGWKFINPGLINPFDNPWVHPLANSAPSLAGLGCKKLLVFVSSEDELRYRGVHYYESVKTSGYQGDLSLYEVQGEGHAFYFIKPESENAKNMFKHLAAFLQD
ncbi:2-hydroxyisoflavanone dehydratase-like [Rutidosis leptorrhynchoides]|uniref:2-hydroxyisoflavanone dehydratase-like n=1 Tax=Rutidosis leptorrhynchoides TaxID=125765 RepID=UPI003A99A291